jgi:hypothetical protein
MSNTTKVEDMTSLLVPHLSARGVAIVTNIRRPTAPQVADGELLGDVFYLTTRTAHATVEFARRLDAVFALFDGVRRYASAWGVMSPHIDALLSPPMRMPLGCYSWEGGEPVRCAGPVRDLLLVYPYVDGAPTAIYEDVRLWLNDVIAEGCGEERLQFERAGDVGGIVL